MPNQINAERESRFLEMLKTMRPDMSKAHLEFGAKFLQPLMGKPDLSGNYSKLIGTSRRIMFAAHSDTVHKYSGTQRLTINYDKGIVGLHKKSKSNCLGADCTTGVHIILEMIRANVPGWYVIFSGEEIGCLGSQAFVKANKAELKDCDVVISLDRKGYDSIITHQMARRTCSDEFAASLAGVLGMPDLKADNSGAYTDSNEFRRHVSECCNLSVGYFNQHGNTEYQDLDHLDSLCDAMIRAQWDKLESFRDETIAEMSYVKSVTGYGKGLGGWPGLDNSLANDWTEYGYGNEREYSMRELVRDFPHAIADWLEDAGVNVTELQNELGVGSNAYGKDWHYGG